MGSSIWMYSFLICKWHSYLKTNYICGYEYTNTLSKVPKGMYKCSSYRQATMTVAMTMAMAVIDGGWVCRTTMRV